MKNNLKYYWWQLKAEVLGGIDVIKGILNEVDIKEAVKNCIKKLKEDDIREAQEKRNRKQEILKPGMIIEFRQPECLGNILKCEVVDNYYDTFMDVYRIEMNILETGLRHQNINICMRQDVILENLIKIHK